MNNNIYYLLTVFTLYVGEERMLIHRVLVFVFSHIDRQK